MKDDYERGYERGFRDAEAALKEKLPKPLTRDDIKAMTTEEVIARKSEVDAVMAAGRSGS
jgi:hypothetical protein